MKINLTLLFVIAVFGNQVFRLFQNDEQLKIKKPFNGNDPSKSKPHGKGNKTKKSSKKKNADSDNQGPSSKEQDDAVPSSADGRYVNT